MGISLKDSVLSIPHNYSKFKDIGRVSYPLHRGFYSLSVIFNVNFRYFLLVAYQLDQEKGGGSNRGIWQELSWYGVWLTKYLFICMLICQSTILRPTDQAWKLLSFIQSPHLLFMMTSIRSRLLFDSDQCGEPWTICAPGKIFWCIL